MNDGAVKNGQCANHIQCGTDTQCATSVQCAEESSPRRRLGPESAYR